LKEQFKYSLNKQACSVSVMVFNTTFNNISVISWQSVLLVEETGGPGENEILLKVVLNTITLTLHACLFKEYLNC
jgi:carbamoylphosphate synthase small subunit